MILKIGPQGQVGPHPGATNMYFTIIFNDLLLYNRLANRSHTSCGKVNLGNDQEMAQSVTKNLPLYKLRGGKKLKLLFGTNTKKTYRKPSEQLFPNRRSLSYPN